MKITLDLLHKNNACTTALVQFKNSYPNGIEIPDSCSKIKIISPDEYIANNIKWLLEHVKLNKPIQLMVYCDIIKHCRKWEYDDNGNMIYCKNSNGCWKKWEYDDNGNNIYYEDINGYWEKWEYNDKGNEIYHEDINGYWGRWKYDDTYILINVKTNIPIENNNISDIIYKFI